MGWRQFISDEVGLDLPSLEIARALAAQALGEMAREILPKQPGGRVLRIEVTEGGPDALANLLLTYEIS